MLVLEVAHLAVGDAHDALLAEEAQAHLLEAVKVFCLLANLLLGALSLGLKCLTNGVQTLFGVVLQDLRDVGEDLSRALRALVFLHGIGHCHSSLRTTGTLGPVGWFVTMGRHRGDRESSPIAPGTAGAERVRGGASRQGLRAHILPILDQRTTRKHQSARIVHPGALML